MTVPEFFKALSERLMADGFTQGVRHGMLRWTYETTYLTDYIGHRGAILQITLNPWNPERTQFCVKVYGRLLGFGSDLDIYTEDHDLDVAEAALRIQSYMRTLKQRSDCFVESYLPQTQELVAMEAEILRLKNEREKKKQVLYNRTRIESDEILKGLAHANG